MHSKPLHVTPLTLLLLAACSDNNLNVGTVDAALDSSPGTGGTGITPTGGSGGGAGGIIGSGGAGGNGGALSEAGVGEQSVCDPLAPVPKPIALGTVLGAGKSASGTIYVADQVDSTQRVFVSDAGGTLVRQRVTGSGSGSGPTFYVFDVADPAQPFVLQIDMPDGGSMRMGVLQGTLKDRKTLVIGQDGEELTVLPSSAIASMPLRNLPGDVYVEYVATLPDGQVMLVTRPVDDWSYTDFRLFLGPPNAVAERPVDSVTRAKDGGTTTILFELDGAQASAFFPVVFADGGFAPGPATLTIAGVASSLTRQTTPPTGASYICQIATGCDMDVASKAIAGLGLTTAGVAQTLNTTLSATLTDANWGPKATACQQGGYDITSLAGQTVCLLGQSIVQRCSDHGDTAWVLMSGGIVQCIYETSKAGLPGVYPVGKADCCTDGCQAADGGLALEPPAANAEQDAAITPGCDLQVASQTVAALGLTTVGAAWTLNSTLPVALATDANWGLKATLCQQAGYDITALAGQTICLVGQSLSQTCAASPDTIWVVMSSGTVKCAYESSSTAGNPGLYPVGGTYCQ
jgi:hypothetical protein